MAENEEDMETALSSIEHTENKENVKIESKAEDVSSDSLSDDEPDCTDTSDSDDEDFQSGDSDEDDNRKSERGIYSCPHCHYSCNNKTGLLNHIRTHLKIRTYSCLICKANFDTNDELVAHKEVHRDSCQSFICKKCKLAFTDHCDWLVHKAVHTKQSLFKCEECHKYFKNKLVYKTHLYLHYDKKIECDICGQVFKTPQLYKSHMNLHKSKYECCECGRVFTDSKNLSYHMVSHTGVKLFQCLHCGVGLTNKNQLNTHTETHYNIKPFKCDKCNGRFKKLAYLKVHSCSANPKPKTCECKVCHRKLANKTSLDKHMLLHSDVRPYACEQCGVGFVSHQSLQVHIIYKHSKETPYKCDRCEQQFKMKNGLNRHMHNVHK